MDMNEAPETPRRQRTITQDSEASTASSDSTGATAETSPQVSPPRPLAESTTPGGLLLSRSTGALQGESRRAKLVAPAQRCPGFARTRLTTGPEGDNEGFGLDTLRPDQEARLRELISRTRSAIATCHAEVRRIRYVQVRLPSRGAFTGLIQIVPDDCTCRRRNWRVGRRRACRLVLPCVGSSSCRFGSSCTLQSCRFPLMTTWRACCKQQTRLLPTSC